MPTNESNIALNSSKTNGSTTGDVIMEEMLFEEEQKQNPVKSIDLENLMVPKTSIEKPDNKQQALPVIPTTTIALPTVSTTSSSSSPLTPSPVKKPYTLYKVPHTNHTTPPRISRQKKQLTKEVNTTRMLIHSFISID